MIKKIIAFILILSCCVLPVVSCSVDAMMEPMEPTPDQTPEDNTNQTPEDNTDKTPTVDEDPKVEIAPGTIYYKGSTIGLLINESTPYSSVLFNALAKNIVVKYTTDEETPYEHEIVIGRSDREISLAAYREFETLKTSGILSTLADDVNWLIYSDGSSVAIAYDEHPDQIALNLAIEYFVENLIEETLILDGGVVYRQCVNILNHYQSEDDKQLAIKWNNMKNGVINGAAISAALQDLYSIYDDSLIIWLANLYEHNICQCSGNVCQGGATCGTGAFYYSNSARDNVGYLPDIESTNQALGFLENTGMTDDYTRDLPAEMLEHIGNYVLALQDPDGYFYHPIWGKNVYLSRKSRDLMWAENLLGRLNLAPIYDTPNGTKGSGVKAAAITSPLSQGSAVVAANVVIAATTVDKNLVDDVSFRKYLDSLNIKNNSYSAGNTLAAYFNTIRARDYELARQGAGYSLVDIMIEYLNDAQNPETGTWYYVSPSDPNYSEYYAVNGVMKIACVYEAANARMPNSDKALRAAMDAICSDEVPGACVDIYNTWVAMDSLISIIRNTYGLESGNIINNARAEMRERIDELLTATKEKLLLFKKADGSFSYSINYSSSTSQGAPAAVPNSVEGDVNATIICTRIVNHIYNCLGLNLHYVPIYTHSDMYVFNQIIEEKMK